MKTLDLNAYGVSEMNKQEMQETDGGWRVLKTIVVFWLVGPAIIEDQIVAGFRDGFNEAREDRCNC